jgi:prepilin-type N-terminal cleavage/methylation domain-containing protein
MVRHLHTIAAFTLMELMMVISIIVIIAAASVPALSVFMRGRQLENAGKTIQTAIDTARREAITKRRHCKVVFCINRAQDPPQGRVKIYQIPRKAANITEQGRYIGEVMKLPPGISYLLGYRGYSAPFDDSNEDQSNPSPDAIANYAIEFYSDGSANFGSYTSVSRAQFDIPGSDKADIVVIQVGEPRRCYIDIDPASGKTVYKVEKPGR